MPLERDLIKQIALESGFTLRWQPNGTQDLNPYVYVFAANILEAYTKTYVAGSCRVCLHTDKDHDEEPCDSCSVRFTNFEPTPTDV